MGQSAHNDEPRLELNFPTAHNEHVDPVMPVPLLYVPLVQFEHAETATPVLYAPVGQFEHTEACVPELYVPMLHEGQVETANPKPEL